MKNLLVAVDTWHPKIDGVVRFLENVLPELSKKYNVTVLAPAFDGKAGKEVEGRINVVKIPTSSVWGVAGYPSVRVSLKTLRTIKNLVRESDIVFSQDLAILGAFAIRYGRRYRKPTIMYTHQVSWEQLANVMVKSKGLRKSIIPTLKTIARHLYSKCDLLIIPSENTASLFAEMGVHTRKVIVELGVDVSKFVPPKNKNYAKLYVKIDPKKTVIGYSGRISKEKNLSVLRSAFLELRKKHNATLLVVGGGSKEEERKLRGEDIVITGMKENVLPYIQAMDIFVMPSLTETSSLATMEAMACGVPAIVTSVGSMKDYVKKGFNGYFFPKESPEMLANRIEELLKDREKMKRFGFNARLGIMRYSWKKTVAKIDALLSEFD